ncbi:glucose-1-phosphate adenylyltransferase [Geomesophilobacter sediminis]|uniref:Glucose-1-phosphate adenylyltransferase n=1 Tax=Geomesophilobacter sediminis TaxID=2798584 RepID=A0A8J7J056_9BACT|nr:glucose-1-phosphate adenylyltransferase [Geomesophilobacter sediminis]MBJ6725882.1 glucose-1-phosphate adenylyltransferase [Geomesophilobacter sediminis]
MYAMSNLGKNTIAMVLAGGKGERLSPLTIRRAKPSVMFGGKYKIIDFVLSNLFNSGIKKVYILTQYRAYSLSKHIRESWGKWTGLGEFFVAISPETNSECEEWFKGTADAILQYLRFVESTDADYVAIFGGDHIYKMDISQMIEVHRRNRADITIAALEVPVQEAKRFGVFTVDDDSRVIGFTEKPANPEPIPGRSTCFASMGNYIFSTKKLIEVLQNGKKKHEDLDFGKHVIPMMLESGDKVVAYNFNDNIIPGMKAEERGYWKDVGTIDSYYAANMDLIHVSPQLDLYNYKWPILTNQGNLPPAKTVFDEDDRRGQNIDSYVCAGCITSGGTVRRSILGPRCKVNSYSLVEDCILFENVNVGRHAKLKKVIVDKNIVIPEGTEIGYDHDEDRRRGFRVTESGIVVVSAQTRYEM